MQDTCFWEKVKIQKTLSIREKKNIFAGRIYNHVSIITFFYYSTVLSKHTIVEAQFLDSVLGSTTHYRALPHGAMGPCKDCF